ncbi:MAG: exonuclease SbcCD subunit D, partial [Chloroflexota bacterium]|nr:exonuclease SbcCD subunit D [Chloroflexota bacterium]
MRIIHFADLHLGVENYGRIDPDTGLSTRLGDFLATFDEVVDFAIAERADLVLFCGDAYKSRDPSQTHQREFARRIWRLASAGIPVFLLSGNHDLPNAFGRATAVEIFHTLEVENVTVANAAGTYRVETREGPLQIVALPWARRSGLLAREDTRGLTIDEIHRRMEAILTERIAAEAEGLDGSQPAVLAAHAFVANARVGSERSMTMGHDYVLLPSSVANPAFDYVALGHVHTYQVLSSCPPVVYSGSLQRIDFSEEEDEKGFCVVDIKGKGNVDFRFVPVAARRFVTIEATIDRGESDPTRAVLDAIARRAALVPDAICRLIITVPEALDGMLQEGELRRALKEAHFIAAIGRDVQREHRPRLGLAPVESLAPLEALQLYIESYRPSIDP